LRILFLEDEPRDAELVKSSLEAEGMDFALTRVDTEADFFRSLKQGGIDLILADYTLPSFDGISALNIAQEICPEVPFIFVSGTLVEEIGIEALKRGATDYVSKARLSRIVPSVRRALREASERSQRKLAEEELQQLVDFIPQLVVVLDSDGKFIRANRMLQEYTGLTPDEFRSPDALGKIIHPDDLQMMRAARERGLKGEEPFELDTRVRQKDGTYRWHLTRYNPLLEGGRARRWYMSATEIESRKQEEEQVRQANVRLEERTRIAQELHDTLLQHFVGASMQLLATLNGISEDSPVKARLDQILHLMELGMDQGRIALQGLRSSETPLLNIVQAFSDIPAELPAHPDVDFEVNVTGQQRRLKPSIHHEVYRIGKEAIINAFRHSRAKRVQCELEYADSEFRIRVRDDGCGIDDQVLQTGCEGHWGLAGMRERAEKIGGKLKISSSAATGTEVHLSIPGEIAFQGSPADHVQVA
jgi:PAS domain S-box-containing protein